MQIDLAQKVVLVTGAGRGIGRGLALGLGAEGAHVAVLTRRPEQAAAVAEEIGQLPDAEALPVVADVRDEDAIRKSVAAVDRRWGRIDALINNAGVVPKLQSVLEGNTQEFREVLDTNVVGSFLMTKHVAPVMIRNGGGRIVYLTSNKGSRAGVGQAMYGGSKAALNILSNVVHQELAQQGVRTVALAPGFIDTPGLRQVRDEAYLARVAASYPGNRIGRPSDLVGLVAFLCSDLAGDLSGTLLEVRPSS